MLWRLINPPGRTMTLESTQRLTNEYQQGKSNWGSESDRYLGLITLLPSRADYLEVLGASETVQVCIGIVSTLVML
jgi:hypothetical protein